MFILKHGVKWSDMNMEYPPLLSLSPYFNGIKHEYEFILTT